MNNKMLIGSVLAIVIVVSGLFVGIGFIGADSSQPTISVVLSGTTATTVIPLQAVGTSFIVDIRVDNTGSVATGINGASYTLTWDSSVLSCTNVADPGPFWGSLQRYVTTIDLGGVGASGTFTSNAIVLDTSNATASVVSTGVIATLTFQVLSTGSSNLHLKPSSNGVAYLSTVDSSGNSQDVQTTAIDATYGTPTPTPAPSPSPSPTPSASASPSPAPSPMPTPGTGLTTINVTCYTPPYFVNATNPLFLDSNSTISLIANVTGANPTGTVTWTTNSTTGSFNSTSTPLISGISAVTYRDTQPGNVTITASYNGDSINSANSSTLKLALYNIDFNHDGTVNFQDTVYLADNFILCAESKTFDHACDLNHDGTLDYKDLEIYAAAYLNYGGSLTSTTNPSPTHGPTAVLSIQNGTTYQSGSTIVLNGTLSTAGYDTQTCPITNYAWLVQYANGTNFGANNGPVASLTAPIGTMILNITLTVTSPDVAASPSQSYVSTSVASVWINIQQRSYAQIDVFTNKGGIGANVASDSFGPQELIQMYANVTSNNAVAGKEVTFTVLSPNDTVALVQQAPANTTGIAQTSYDIPWLGNSNFGTWQITASVTIANITASDKTSFSYNYLITANGITLPASVHRGGTMAVTVNLASIENTTLPLTTTISLYDAQNVPISSYVSSATQEAPGNSTVQATFTIPNWAFVGTATVLVNVLTSNPTSNGVGYSPEEIQNFQILT